MNREIHDSQEKKSCAEFLRRHVWDVSPTRSMPERRYKEAKEDKSERRMPRLSGGDEGRGKLRKAAGICKQELIRGYPNGGTRQVEDLSLTISEGEPGELKHLSTRRKRKKVSIP